MERRTTSLLTLIMLLLLFSSAAVYWISLPVPMARNAPALAHIIRRVVLVSPQEKLEWTEEDREVQKGLQDMLMDRQPPQRMIFDRNREMEGRVVEEMPDAVVFAAQIGDSGEVSMAISRDRIVRVEDLEMQVPEITLRDVRFCREFPGKKFYKRPPYTIITEEPYFAVDRIVEQQRRLYDRFVKLFSPLIESTRRNDIQLLIFSDSNEFEKYRFESSEVQKGANGFYNIRKDRLIVLLQKASNWVQEGRKEIAGVVKKHQDLVRTDQARQRLMQWEDDAQEQLNAHAAAMTRSILYHEGAHQLSYNLGVLSKRENGRLWVSEGLATWFETEQPGGANSSRSMDLSSAIQKGELLSLHQLLSVSSFRTALQYAQAWSLTDFLMQPEYRPAFYSYLSQIRSLPEPLFHSPEDELCDFIGLSPLELQHRWMAFMNTD